MTDRLDAAYGVLARHHVMSLALCDGDRPRVCSLMYVVGRGFRLMWVSDPAARHSRLIDDAGAVRAAVTVAPDYADYRDIRGLQLGGVARRLEGLGETGKAMALLMGRYSFLAQLAARPSALADALAAARVYCFEPDELTFIDNTTTFGGKDRFSASELAVFAQR